MEAVCQEDQGWWCRENAAYSSCAPAGKSADSCFGMTCSYKIQPSQIRVKSVVLNHSRGQQLPLSLETSLTESDY